MTAANILKPEHPLHQALVRFCKGKPVTKRQARKFLKTYGKFYKES